MASFTRTKYESNNGDVHGIRIASDRVTAAGAAPSGDVNDVGTVQISKGKRQFGLRPRGVVLVRTLGTAPNQFKKYSFLPCLTTARYNALTEGTEVEIGGVDWKVLRQVPEQFA
jgi:hypothetical protein